MVKKGELFNAYSSYFNILENVGQYPQGDANRLILLSFLEQMKADGFYNTLSAEDRKVIDKIIDCIRKKLCILPYTSTCMKKKVDKVYIGEYEDCIFYNKTVPQYENMNANWQIQTVYCAKNAQNYNNGRKVTVWQNTNALFKGPQTKTEITLDTSSCPYNAPNWVEQSRSCEQVSGVNTGYVLVLYRDTNTNSSTYGQTKTEKILDTTTCPLPNTDPTWVEISRACKTVSYDYSDDPDALHTYGVAAVTYRDINPLSDTPEDEREYTTEESDSDCPQELIGYLTYNNGELTKTVETNSAVYSATFHLIYHINDVLQDPWHGNVQPFTGELNIVTNEEDCTITVNAPKNTTGTTRTLVGTIGADYFDGAVTFTLIQAADAIFQWNDTTGYENATASGWVRQFHVTSTAGGEFHAYQVLGYTAGISASISGTTVTVTVAQNTQTVSTTKILRLKQKDSNMELALFVSQEAASQPQPVPVFSVSPSSLTFANTGGTKTLTVTSTIDGAPVGYTYVNNFSNATVTHNGNTVTVTANSTNVVLSGNIVFTQNTSLETVTIPITQTAPADVYEFTWENGITSDKELTISRSAQDCYFVVVSTKNGNLLPYTTAISGVTGWVAEMQNDGNLHVHTTGSSSPNALTGTVKLTQTEPSVPKELTLKLTQQSQHAIEPNLKIKKASHVGNNWYQPIVISVWFEKTVLDFYDVQKDIDNGNIGIQYISDTEHGGINPTWLEAHGFVWTGETDTINGVQVEKYNITIDISSQTVSDTVYIMLCTTTAPSGYGIYSTEVFVNGNPV